MDTPFNVPAWDCSMALGIDAIDHGHQALYAALRALEARPPDAYADAFATVVAAAERDFRGEEALMEAIAYPSLPVHREQHARVLGGLHHAMAAAAEGDTAPARRAVVLLAEWMTLHQQTMDAALALALRLAQEQEQDDAPSPIPEFTMFKSILVPTDGSPLSIEAIRTAVELARQHEGGIVALSVARPAPALSMAGVEFAPPDGADDESGRIAEARQRAEYAVQAARAAGVPARAVVAISPRPHEEIVHAGREQHCDVIVMATHARRGLHRLVMGSETEKVLLHASIPVLVLRPRAGGVPPS